MNRDRLQHALQLAAAAVVAHGRAAHPLFARLEAELAALDVAEAQAEALAARAATLANQPFSVSSPRRRISRAA